MAKPTPFSCVKGVKSHDGADFTTLVSPTPRVYARAFASSWNLFVHKKILEEHEYNLRNVANFPGTGLFRHVRRVDKEIWIMEKNPDYWNKGLSYLDRIEVYHIPPWTPEVGAALLAGKVDYVRTIDPVAARKVQASAGMTFVDFYQSVIHAIWVNNTKKPFDDPRVRRAMHLALDKPILVDEQYSADSFRAIPVAAAAILPGRAPPGPSAMLGQVPLP